jgi:hypothetical protein
VLVSFLCAIHLFGAMFEAVYTIHQIMHNYQQLDLQALIDLLATETQEYTRAFTRGIQDEIAVRKIVIEALITEIRRRKKEDVLPQNVLTVIAPTGESKQE